MISVEYENCVSIFLSLMLFFQMGYRIFSVCSHDRRQKMIIMLITELLATYKLSDVEYANFFIISQFFRCLFHHILVFSLFFHQSLGFFDIFSSSCHFFVVFFTICLIFSGNFIPSFGVFAIFFRFFGFFQLDLLSLFVQLA